VRAAEELRTNEGSHRPLSSHDQNRSCSTIVARIWFSVGRRSVNGAHEYQLWNQELSAQPFFAFTLLLRSFSASSFFQLS